MFISINNGILPKRKTAYSAGYDVYSNQDITIIPNQTCILPLGIALDHNWIQQNCDTKFLTQHYFGLHIRSSLAAKGIILNNSVGIIDLDYPDEIKAIISNISSSNYSISKGSRIAQLILHPHHGIKYLGDLYSDNLKREGGFGSTGGH